MSITNSELRRLLPHAGRMCLLDSVSDWSDSTVICVSHSHRDPNNPLRQNGGRLAGLHAFEYAAQAAAVHGGLLARQHAAAYKPNQVQQPPPTRYLAALKNGRLYLDYLDTVSAPLDVTAHKLLGDIDTGQFIYDAWVSAAGERLAEVRISVMGSVG